MTRADAVSETLFEGSDDARYDARRDPGESAREQVPLVRMVCWVCKANYAYVVNVDCTLCAGAGVVAAPVPVGIRAIVAARAASLDIEWRPTAEQAELRRIAGRLAADDPSARGILENPLGYERATVGRLARALLSGRPVGPGGWVKGTAADRERIAAELVALAGELAGGA